MARKQQEVPEFYWVQLMEIRARRGLRMDQSVHLQVNGKKRTILRGKPQKISYTEYEMLRARAEHDHDLMPFPVPAPEGEE